MKILKFWKENRDDYCYEYLTKFHIDETILELSILKHLYDNYKKVSKGKKSYDEFKLFLTLIDFTKIEELDNE